MIPAFGLVVWERLTWLPPVPIPLFLLWPLVAGCWGLAWLLARRHPLQAEALWFAVKGFQQLRDVRMEAYTQSHGTVRLWFA